jgi:tetratricopeptide (TPR) repeat protein
VSVLLTQELGLPPARTATGRARALERLDRLLLESGVPPDDHVETTAPAALALELGAGAAPRGDPPSSLRDRIAFALATLWGQKLRAPARLVVIEDWHWLDAPSAEVLSQVLAAGGTGAELFVLTSRPRDDGGAPAWPPAVSPVIRLGELHGEDAAALAHARLGEDAPAEDVAQVLRRAGGNPLFIEELSAALHDFVPGELPENARSVIAARVDRLPRGAKAALQYAAVYGALVKSRFLEDLLGHGVARGLALLEQTGLLVRRARSDDEAAEGDLEFRHGMLQEVVYESLSGAARREAHRRIGRLLADHFEGGRAPSPATVARHLELGGDGARAGGFWLRAGRLALAAFDARAAHDAFARALALGAGDPETEREAHAGNAQALTELGEHDAARRDLEALVELSRGSESRLADAWGRMAVLHLRTGDLASALAAADLAARGADPRVRGLAHRVRAEAYERRAQLDPALAEVGRALEIARRLGEKSDELECLVVAGRIHMARLRIDAALIQYLPALDRAIALGDPRIERILRNNLAIAYLLRGSFEDALASAERGLELCRRLGDRAREGDALGLLGAIHLELGRGTEAEDYHRRAMAIHETTGARLARADVLVYSGRRAALAGDLAASERTLLQAVDVAVGIGARSVLANAKSQLAWTLVAAGQHARAEALAAEAAALAREAALPGFEIQALSRLALARLEGGDAARARGPSEKAVALLDPLGVMEWSEEEVYYTHHRILRALRDPGAGSFLARAHAGFASKLGRIESETLRGSFAAVSLHRRIHDDFQVLGAASSTIQPPPTTTGPS